MHIVWDEPKRLANLGKHKLDFRDLTQAFFENALFRPGHSGRWRAIGYQGGAATAVVFKTLGTEAVSVISMRPASDSERKLLDG